MSPGRSRQLLEALQQQLSDAGIESFFSAADDHILLDVYAASESVTVQVAEPDEGRESFAWRDPDGKFHREPPAQTLAWLRAYATPPETSGSTTRTEH
jgi:hypothetical protein